MTVVLMTFVIMINVQMTFLIAFVLHTFVLKIFVSGNFVLKLWADGFNPSDNCSSHFDSFWQVRWFV